MDAIWSALVEAGLLPPAAVLPDRLADCAAGDDLLPLLIAAGAGQGGPPTRRRGPSVVPGLQECHGRGAQLTGRFPGAAGAHVAGWLGRRLFLWPSGVPGGRRIGVVSSRLGRDLDLHRTWFAVLRAVCMRLDAGQELLLTAGRTTPQRFVQRCGVLFGLRVCSLDFGRGDGRSLRRWTQAWRQRPEALAANGAAVFVSPPLSGAAPEVAGVAETPAPDRAVVAGSDRLVVLHLRRGGHVERLVRARLADPRFPAASVYVALGPDLVPPDVAEELLGCGAVGWYLWDAPGQRAADGPAPWAQGRAVGGETPRRIDVAAFAGGQFLTHCTRRRHGPWPDQREEQFLDDLILDRAGADHSAFAALWRIVQSRRLIATTDMVRGDVPVVSFTAVPVGELARLHAFRAHLGRWDFEPYGIAIRRDWLECRGTRPACYGEAELWDRLPSGERPFFQLGQSRSAAGTVRDWTVEREWRHVGDVRLDDIPADAAFLFVPTAEEAEQVARISRWPVAVAEREKRQFGNNPPTNNPPTIGCDAATIG